MKAGGRRGKHLVSCLNMTFECQKSKNTAQAHVPLKISRLCEIRLVVYTENYIKFETEYLKRGFEENQIFVLCIIQKIVSRG